MNMSPVTVYQTFSSADAQLIRSMLEAADLHPIVSDELAALSMDGYSMATGGIRVQVPESEVELARELIQTQAAPPPEAEGGSQKSEV